MDTQFKSLFLPLGAKDRAVFAAPLTLVASAAEAAEAAAAEGGGGAAAAEEGPRSLLLAMAAGRADGAVAVLRSMHVVFFSLRDAARGPYEVRRLRPVAPKARRGHAPAARPEATCAVLIPLDISFACRIHTSVAGIRTSANGSVAGEGSAPPPPPPPLSFAYLRGVVGSSDGRLSLFSEESFSFSFAAHDGPVASVETVFMRDDGGGGSGSGSRAASAGEAAGGVRTLTAALANLGIVSCGADMVVYLWRHSPLSGRMAPNTLVEPTVFSRHATFCVHHPPAGDWLLASPLAHSPAAAAALFPCSLFCYSSGGTQHGLHVRPLAAGAPRTTLPLPRGFLARATAVAASDSLALVAVGRVLYATGLDAAEAAPGACVRVAALPHEITSVALRDCLAAAVCGPAGVVFAFHVAQAPAPLLLRSPLTPLGSYRTAGGAPLRSVALHAPAMMMALVTDGDDGGAAELVLVPRGRRPFALAHPTHGPLTRLLPAAAALRHECRAEELAQDGAAAAAAPGQYAALLEGWREQAHLARAAVSLECEPYLHNSANVC